ncbi:MAG: hypothetical protein B6D61_05730 [Bacteroidetes bacterium 4484_249]|nr:MAG: hypothetical protein B6D61_05730 [Bacteroidetes bacterium 4484_249]
MKLAVIFLEELIYNLLPFFLFYLMSGSFPNFAVVYAKLIKKSKSNEISEQLKVLILQKFRNYANSIS